MPLSTAKRAEAATCSPAPDPYAALARELDAIGDAVRADLGAADRAYIRARHRGPAPARARRPGAAARRALPSRPRVAGTARAHARQGHREHGDRPQRHARPVGLDARPGDPLDARGSGTPASTAASWKHAHNYQHHTYTNVARQGPRPRLLGDARRARAAVAPGLPAAARLLLPDGARSSSGASRSTTWSSTPSAAARRPRSRRAREIDAPAAQGAPPGRSRTTSLFPALAGRAGRAARAGRRTSSRTSCATSGCTRSSSAATSPRAPRRSPRSSTTTRRAAAGTAASCSGSCNLEGSRLFHLLTGNLSFQIEHHLFPDLPSNRYAEIAPQVREVCERHGLPYNSGRLGRQYRSVLKQVLRLALPGG